ncbi:hypothetical protein ADK43_09115 [Streptomyces rimosus subsp. rimosus]|nr:hypothetical protein ADK43_09115 [Streptomyces rimosus subsp. rimosus]
MIGQLVMNSTNADHAAGRTRNAGPSLTLESRTPTWVARFATSTQLLPVPSLYDDLNQAPSWASAAAGM